MTWSRECERQPADETAREAHRAEPRPVERQPAVPPQLGVHEAPVEADVVRHEDPARERGEDRVRRHVEGRRAGHHRVGDAGERGDLRRKWRSRG